MSEEKSREVNYFGFKLNQTSAIILFFLALSSIISAISPMYNFLSMLIGMIPTLQIEDLMMWLINITFFSIILSINIFTVVICSRVRNNHINDEHGEIYWFGFEISETTATVLFILSLIGLIGFFMAFYGFITSLITLWHLYSGLDVYFIVYLLVPRILSISISVVFLAIDIYTIRKCIFVKRKLR